MAKKTAKKTAKKGTTSKRGQRLPLPPEITKVQQEIELDESMAMILGKNAKSTVDVYVVSYEGDNYGPYGKLSDARKHLRKLKNPSAGRGNQLPQDQQIARNSEWYEKFVARITNQLTKRLSSNSQSIGIAGDLQRILSAINNDQIVIETDDDSDEIDALLDDADDSVEGIE